MRGVGQGDAGCGAAACGGGAWEGPHGEAIGRARWGSRAGRASTGGMRRGVDDSEAALAGYGSSAGPRSSRTLTWVERGGYGGMELGRPFDSREENEGRGNVR